jgi:putative transposase
MKRSRFTGEQIIAFLRQAKAGVRVVDLCRQNGISDATIYKWRSKFGGMNISDVKRLCQLADENARLKRLVGEQALDIVVLKDVLSKTFEARSQQGSRALHSYWAWLLCAAGLPSDSV